MMERTAHHQWADGNYVSDKWIKSKYLCQKETKKCEIYSWMGRNAGRCKCTPCQHLKVIHSDGSITLFNSDGSRISEVKTNG